MKITPPLVRFVPHFPMTGEDDVRQVFVETEEDKKKLREAAAKEGPYMLGLVEIGLTYGWRRGSLLSMKVKNVDLLRETLYCSESKNGAPTRRPCWRALEQPWFHACVARDPTTGSSAMRTDRPCGAIARRGHGY